MNMERKAIALALAGLLSGCTSIDKSIAQRVKLSEACRVATTAKLLDTGPRSAIASIHLGNVGYCDVGSTETLIPICSLNQIRFNYNLVPANSKLAKTLFPPPFASSGTPPQADTAAARQDDPLEKFDKSAEKFHAALDTLNTKLVELDAIYQNRLLGQNLQYAARTEALKQARRQVNGLLSSLGSVRLAQNELLDSMAKLGPTVERKALNELAAWDSNMRALLAQLDQLLAGDYNLIWRDDLRDQVLTHVARRSLELLHGALKPADKIMTRLDDKAHGAISIGYLAFGSSIQDAVNGAFTEVKNVYRQRVADIDAPEIDGDKLKPFFVELGRAACNNLVEGTQFSMLSELVDTMLVTQIDNEYRVFTPASGTKTASQAPGDKTRVPSSGQSRHFVWSETGSVLLENAALALEDVDIASIPSAPDNLAAPRVTSLGVYATNEWTARQQLLVEKMTAKSEAALASGATPAFPGIETVEESTVRQLADAATAKSVDDAARLHPDMLARNPSDINSALANSVNIATAASIVNQVSVTLKVNLSVSNVNTFNPANTNNFSPVIQLAPVVGRAPDLCLSVDPGAACTSQAEGYVISFDRPSFKNDSCNTADMEPYLSQIGARIASYRMRYGIEYDATIQGFASSRKAQLAQCPAARLPKSACHYVNLLRQDVEAPECRQGSDDRNIQLSAARAIRAAEAIERAGNGAVVVTGLAARGTETAKLRGQNAVPESDQTVVVRLTRRTPH